MAWVNFAIVGERLSGLEIDLAATVEYLKTRIKAEHSDIIQCPAPQLALYMARRDGEWLTGSEVTDAVRKGGVPEGIKALMREEMLPVAQLNDDEYFGQRPVGPVGRKIHLLVELPRQPKRRRLGVTTTSDGSLRWLESFRRISVPTTSFPEIQELKDFVANPLPLKLELSEADYKRVCHAATEAVCEKIFAINDDAPCTKLWYDVFSRVASPGSVGTSESSFHKFWDTFILEPVAAVFAQLGGKVDRDQSNSSSTTALKWPDMIFTLNDICVFRGVEKAPGPHSSIPSGELQGKLLWSYGKDVRYIFGYTAVGYDCALFAIFSPDQKTVCTEQIASYSTGSAVDRYELVLALLPLCRLFPEIVRMCPDVARQEFVTIPRDSGLVVRLDPMAVERDFTNARSHDGTPIDKEQLRVKYETIEGFGVHYMEVLTRSSLCGYKFTFEPRGFSMVPSSLTELFCALRCILTALVRLHETGWMHRDIRWANVMNLETVHHRRGFSLTWPTQHRARRSILVGCTFVKTNMRPRYFTPRRTRQRWICGVSAS